MKRRGRTKPTHRTKAASTSKPVAPKGTPGKIRLTARGIGLIATAVVLLAIGLRLHLAELVGLAISLAALPIVGLLTLLIATRSGKIRVAHTVPQRMISGETGRVTAIASNWRPIADALISQIQDRLSPSLCGSPVQVTATPIGRQLDYTIRPNRTGRWLVGPLRIRYADPFGFAKADQALGTTTSVLVWPRTITLPVVGSLASDGGVGTNPTPGMDDATLRAYLPGDDLRRIHWPTSARRGLPMIRESETRAVSPVQVLIDPVLINHPKYSEWTLEHAASLACSALEAGHPVRIMGSGEPNFVDCQATGRAQLLTQIADYANVARRHRDLSTLTFPAQKRGTVTYALVSAAKAPLPPTLGGPRFALLVGQGARPDEKRERLQATGWRAVHLPEMLAHHAAFTALTGSAAGWKAAA